jgi:heat shock protein HtpX
MPDATAGARRDLTLSGQMAITGLLGIMLTISRCREYTADRGAVLLTGAPEQLMSALQRIAGRMAEIPSADLRQVARRHADQVVAAVARAGGRRRSARPRASCRSEA